MRKFKVEDVYFFENTEKQDLAWECARKNNVPMYSDNKVPRLECSSDSYRAYPNIITVSRGKYKEIILTGNSSPRPRSYHNPISFEEFIESCEGYGLTDKERRIIKIKSLVI